MWCLSWRDFIYHTWWLHGHILMIAHFCSSKFAHSSWTYIYQSSSIVSLCAPFVERKSPLKHGTGSKIHCWILWNATLQLSHKSEQFCSSMQKKSQRNAEQSTGFLIHSFPALGMMSSLWLIAATFPTGLSVPVYPKTVLSNGVLAPWRC